MKKVSAVKAVLVAFLCAVACNPFTDDIGTDAGADTDTDTDTDADTDTDTDTDSDTDSDTDTDTEIEEDASWVEIPAGSFWMGSPTGDCPADYPSENCALEIGRGDDEVLHYVTLTRSFKLRAYETTQGEFDALMEWNPSHFGPNGEGVDCGGECPVEKVSWFDAAAYADELSLSKSLTPCYTLTSVVCADSTNVGDDYMACMNAEQGGVTSANVALNGGVSTPYDCEGYRLPTESEWEYAIRAGSITTFYPSDGNDGTQTSTLDDPNLNQIAWYEVNSAETTHPVGTKEPNAWGLYDLGGNVWEWIWDFYDVYPEGSMASPAVDPAGAATGATRLERGGAYSIGVSYCRSAGLRGNLIPGNRIMDVGFRLARTIQEAK